jgi:hypothetical protein
MAAATIFFISSVARELHERGIKEDDDQIKNGISLAEYAVNWNFKLELN